MMLKLFIFRKKKLFEKMKTCKSFFPDGLNTKIKLIQCNIDLIIVQYRSQEENAKQHLYSFAKTLK